ELKRDENKQPFCEMRNAAISRVIAKLDSRLRRDRSNDNCFRTAEGGCATPSQGFFEIMAAGGEDFSMPRGFREIAAEQILHPRVEAYAVADFLRARVQDDRVKERRE